MTRYRGQFGDTETCIELEHVTDEDMCELHEWLSPVLLAAGLDGRQLDEALSGMLGALLPILERERHAAAKRPEPTLRVVN